MACTMQVFMRDWAYKLTPKWLDDRGYEYLEVRSSAHASGPHIMHGCAQRKQGRWLWQAVDPPLFPLLQDYEPAWAPGVKGPSHR